MENPVITLSLAQLSVAFLPVLVTLVVLWRWSLGAGNAAYALGRLPFRGKDTTLYLILSLTMFPLIAVIGSLDIVFGEIDR